MKRNLLIASIAGVTALSSIAAFASNSTVAAAQVDGSGTQNTTQSRLVSGLRQKMQGKGQFGTGATGGNMNRGNGQQGGERKGPGGAMGFRGGDKMEHMFENNTAAKTAIQNGDYNAFVTAMNADTNKPADAKTPTQDQFNKMVTEYKKQQKKETAITNNDYAAYVAAITPTKDEFAKIVVQHNTHKAIETAMTNKDYNAFVAALKADTNRPSDATIPTETEFTNMINNKNNRPVRGAQNAHANHTQTTTQQ